MQPCRDLRNRCRRHVCGRLLWILCQCSWGTLPSWGGRFARSTLSTGKVQVSPSSCLRCLCHLPGDTFTLSAHVPALPCCCCSYAGASSCTPCPPGKFGAVRGISSSCSGVCPVGRYSEGASVGCSPCPVGTALPSGGGTSPATCALTTCTSRPGFYCGLGATSVEGDPCPPGRFSATFNASECSACKPGWVAPATGLPSCFACANGRYSTPDLVQCNMCPRGRYGDDTGPCGTAACSGPCDAAPGSTCAPGSTLPYGMPCPPGQYGLGGTWDCMNCPAGRFGTGPGLNSSQCSGACSKGRFSSPGSVQCVGECNPGYFSVEGSADCAPCPAGRVCPLGAIEPALCPAGRFSFALAVACANCSAGYACSPGATSATPASDACPGGRFSAGPGWPACQNCTAGFACPPQSTTASPPLSTCPSGRYAEDGAAVCSYCADGYFGQAAGATHPNCSGPCLPGFTCSNGATSPTALECPAGTFSFAASGSCTQCDSGRYGAVAGLNSSQCSGACTAGYT
jgi:hypothetical protein